MDAGLKAVVVEVTEDELKVELLDGRTIIVPLAWYPRLLHATPAQARIGRSQAGDLVFTGPTSTRF